MKIAISQKRLYMNNPQKNFDLLKADVNKAIGKADLIVFSELSLSSTLIGDRIVNDTLLNTLSKLQKQVIKLSQDIPIVWGNLHQMQGEAFNALFYAKEGQLESYGFEDEPFEFTLNNQTFTVSHDPMVTPNLNLVLGMHPYEHEKISETYPNTLKVGSDGLSNNGHEVYQLDNFGYLNYKNKTQIFYDDFIIIDTQNINTTPVPKPTLLDHLIKGIQYFDEENLAYKPTWLVGVSGGLDSALSVTLLTLALGKARVHGVSMPGPFTREITLKNAQHLFKALDISHETIDIKPMVDATVSAMNHGDITGLAYENIQARLRGHTLMTLASLKNGIVSNNGNKIEAALGYATLYGDAIGGLSLLGDLTKLEVGQLAKEINQKKEIIPNNLIPNINPDKIEWEFAPSAELSEGQFDPMKWGYHDLLIPYLMENSVESFLEKVLDTTLFKTPLGQYLKGYQLSPEAFIQDLEWVVRSLNLAVYKRIQTPPVLKVSRIGFGVEPQVPLMYSDKYQLLKDKILKKDILH